MSNKVKHYICGLHTGITAGWATNTAESIIGLMRSIFITGFNSSSITTLSRSGSTVNVYVSTGHGFTDKQVILITGATDAAYNGEWTCTYIDANNVSFNIGAATPATPASVPGTVKAAPLGWTELFTGNADKMVLRSSNAAGSQMYYRFWEPATQTITRSATGGVVSLAGMKAVEMGMYSDMVGIDTGAREVYNYMHKNPAANTATGRNMIVVGDDTTALVFLQQDNASPIHMMHGFGDYLPLNPADRWNAMLMGKYGMGTTSEAIVTTFYTGCIGNFSYSGNWPVCALLPRMPNGDPIVQDLKAGLASVISSAFNPGVAGNGNLPLIHQFGGYRRGFPVYLKQVTLGTWPHTVRGQVPGLYQTGVMGFQPSGYEFVPNMAFGSVTGATGLMIRTHNANGPENGSWTVDITGPWR